MGLVKKETVITAIVFFSVGFLAGYIYQAQRSSASAAIPSVAPPASPADSGAAGATAAAGSAPGSNAPLPAGHPPLDDATRIRFYTEEASQNANDPAPRLKLADFLYDKKRYSEAIPWYRQSLALDPRNADAQTDLGTCYFSLGHPHQAIAQFNKALQIDPNHAPTIFNMIVVNLEGTHDLAAARKAYQRLAQLDPNYPGLSQIKQSLDAAAAGKRSGPSAATP